MPADRPTTEPVPRHVAVIMDGNGRWAGKRGLPRTLGHRRGAQAVRALVTGCAQRGVAHLTVFAFSSENWRRPDDEVGTLMALLLESLDGEVAELDANGVRLRFIGERASLQAALRERIAAAERLTAGNQGLALNVALDYGGRWDLVQAARALAAAAARGERAPASIDEAAIAEHLALAGQPAPDLLIRTGGEQRISNFLLWDMAYTELYFTELLWPDFDAAALDEALAWYAGRQRRFGAVLEAS
jgi:undecaprenyl diphosphate synthase